MFWAKAFFLHAAFIATSVALPLGPNPRVVVHVCPEVSISDGLAGSAISEASRILRSSGITFTWSVERSPAACLYTPAVDLIVRIVSDAPSDVPANQLAVANWHGLRRSATIYSDRAMTFRGQQPLLFLGIGRAIAHEITHLLLPAEDSHAHYGLMRPHWSTQDFGTGAGGCFSLTPEAVAAMQREAGRMERLRTAASFSQ